MERNQELMCSVAAPEQMKKICAVGAKILKKKQQTTSQKYEAGQSGSSLLAPHKQTKHLLYYTPIQAASSN